MCPIHRHFLSLTDCVSGCRFVLSQRVELDIRFGQKIPNMRRRHLFTNTWSLFMVFLVAPHVSHPYSNTLLTQASKILILTFLLIPEAFRLVLD